jgi:hypothetical protein
MRMRAGRRSTEPRPDNRETTVVIDRVHWNRIRV